MVSKVYILTFPSHLSEIWRAEFFLKEFFRDKNIPQFSFKRALLCLSEAVVNAIEHGNQSCPDKLVTVKLSLHESFLVMEVVDEGNGFDFHSLSDPTQPCNIKKESGRGVFIINSFADSCEFRHPGNHVIIKIKCK